MRALILEKGETAPVIRLGEFDEGGLEGAVTIRVSHSAMNYKDGLAIARGAPVVRRWPMIAGIECAGMVEHSEDPRWQPGDEVIVQGHGMGETALGTYADRVRVPADWPIRRPDGFSAAQAMAVGVAGFTAMLCVMALERHGAAPADGPALVTGAAGGVGSVAVALLHRLGWHVVASTGRAGEAPYLRELGAAEVIDRAELSASGKPLARERWAVAVDSVGSHTLANALAATKAAGAVAACGLAQGMDLPVTVAPFILRGVSLLGIDSTMCPQPRRVAAWDRLARDLDPALLSRMTTTIPLDEVVALAPRILAGEVRGRTVVEIAA